MRSNGAGSTYHSETPGISQLFWLARFAQSLIFLYFYKQEIT